MNGGDLKWNSHTEPWFDLTWFWPNDGRRALHR